MAGDRMAPFSLDRFGLAVPDRVPAEGLLFPVPDPRELAVGWFGGGRRTAAFIEAGRRTHSAARDFVNRLRTMFHGFGHRPWALQLIAHGPWPARTLESFVNRVRDEAKAHRLLVLDSVQREHGAPFTGASAIVWSERGKGAPVHSLQEGDVLIAAADVRSLAVLPDKPPAAPFPDWCGLMEKVRRRKYPRRSGVVRFAFLCEDFRLRALEELTAPVREGLALERIRSGRRPPGMTGVLIGCSPHFAHSIMRRLRYHNHRATAAPCARVVSVS